MSDKINELDKEFDSIFEKEGLQEDEVQRLVEIGFMLIDLMKQ